MTITFKKAHQTISLTSAIGYEMALVGGESAINFGVVIISFILFFPLGILLLLVNICKAPTPIYHVTVYQENGDIDKKVILGTIQHQIAVEMLERHSVPQAKHLS